MHKLAYVPHCDEPNCDLGSLEYTCPNCNLDVSDLDNWFAANAAFNADKPTSLRCPKCDSTLAIEGDGSISRFTPPTA